MRADRIHQIRDHLAGSRVLVVSFDHPIDRCRYLLSTFGDAVNERLRRKTHRTGDRAPMNQLSTPHAGAGTVVRDLPFDPAIHWLIGCVGRLQTVKNQPLLVRAFLRVLADHPDASERLRLVIVGDGPLRADIEVLLKDAGKSHLVWLAGARSDVADVMKMFHCFVLPSQAEGTSCTLQEAMATGLPIVATAVGGTPDLVADGLNGLLVPSGDEAALANAIWQLYSVPDVALKMQSANREKAISKFALSGMIVSYCRIFDGASLHLMERA